MANKVPMRLQGHEKFALRDGWINKALMFIDDNPKVFQGKDGPDVFGIGNNMVKSLRYWLKAFGIIVESPNKGASLTELGKIIKEYDPYLEDNFTLWVLHSNIAKNLEEATSWYMFFNKCNIDNLDREQITKLLVREISKYANGQAFSENSVKSDVDVILSMYSKNKSLVDPEDKNISPFSVLELIKENEGKYSKNQPNRRIINEYNILYELSYCFNDSYTFAIDKLINGEKSISSIYYLSNVIINDYLDKLDSLGYIRTNRTAGLDTIYLLKDITPYSVMKEYYEMRK